MNRILLVFTSWPYPTDNGKKVMLKSILEFIIYKYGEHVIDLILIDNEKIKYNPFKELRIFQIIPNNITKIKNLMFQQNKSFQERVLYDKKVLDLLLNLLENNRYRFVVFDTLRTGQYLEYIPDKYRRSTKFILYMDDLFHLRYERILKSIKNYNLNVADLKLFGNFERFLKNLPLLKFVKNSPNMQLWLLKKEKELIKKRELEKIDMFDKNLLISYEEATLLKSLSKQNNIYVLPPLVDYRPIQRKKKHNENIFIFLGNLAVPHNRISLEYFIKTNIENCIKHIPNFKLLIIGKNISGNLNKLVQTYSKNIEYKGYVNNLNNYMEICVGMVIPLLFGSGVKLKTLEALSYGVPIISTKFGIESIRMDYKLKDEILEENIFNFYKRMIKLTNHEFNEYISNLEKENFLKYYSKQKVEEIYEKIFS